VSASPRIEVLDRRLVALRFNPQYVHNRGTNGRVSSGAVVAGGRTDFYYRLPVPYWLEMARPETLEFVAEMATHAGQRDPRRKHSGSVQIGLNRTTAERMLEDDPEGGGFETRCSVPTRPAPEIEVHIRPEAGVTIYGAGAGRYDFDPTVLVHTRKDVDREAGWSMDENSGTPLPQLKPLFDYGVRDTSITLGADGNYYLTGTTGAPDIWGVTSNLQLWKSPDLKRWTTVIERPRARSVVWSIDRDGSWERPVNLRDGAPFRPLWAPEVHFLKGTYWLTYCVPNRGAGLLKSASGKPEGPYVKAFSDDRPIADGIDASLFEDADGKVYFLYAGGRIARVRDDMTGLAEPFRLLAPSEGAPYVGFEGVFLFKANGKYYLSAADFTFGDYHCYIAMADGIYGPYSPRYLAVPHGGHNVFFKDQQDNWWSTFFGNDVHAPFRDRPAALRVQFTSDGRVQVMSAQP
jgi:hypothetical protein